MPQAQLLHQPPSSNAWRVWPAAAGLVLLAAFLLPLPQNGAIAGLPPICTFHLVTGLPCPGCGLTRSFVSCAHGHWSEAAYYHPLGPPLFAAFIALAAIGLLHALNPRRAAALVAALSTRPRRVRWAAGIAGATLVGIWLVRLAGWLPSPP